MKTHPAAPFLILALLVVAPGCSSTKTAGPQADAGLAGDEVASAVASISPTAGNKAVGTVVFHEMKNGTVRVVADLSGLAPGQQHAMHVHEKGDCSAADGASAGGHFNPQSKDHGLPGAEKRHLGDLGNITIGKDGKGSLDITAPGANLKATDPASFVGRSIIVHAKKDDGGQPTGNAGGRVGCGVIKG